MAAENLRLCLPLFTYAVSPGSIEDDGSGRVDRYSRVNPHRTNGVLGV